MSGESVNQNTNPSTDRISHTPAPWTLRETRSTVSVKSASGETIGSWYAGFASGTVTHANARLIAAAPDLLALLKELIDIEGAQPGHIEWARKVQAAIDKAEGKL